MISTNVWVTMSTKKLMKLSKKLKMKAVTKNVKKPEEIIKNVFNTKTKTLRVKIVKPMPSYMT